MTTKYEVRQSVQSVKKQWQEVVAVEPNERLGRLSFKQLSEEYPEEYFELVEVELVERCLHFTGKGS
jgi:hypothetical protein